MLTHVDESGIGSWMRRTLPLALIAACVLPATTTAAEIARTGTNTAIVLERSIGGVALGESRAAVERLLGRGVLVETHLEGVGAEPRAWVETRVYRDLQVIYARLKGSPPGEGKAALIETSSPRYRTRSGLGVGSRWATVIALGTRGSLGKCATWMMQCQHQDPAGVRLTVFYRASHQRVARIVVTSLGG